MLGCYDFCAHYEWTFDWFRRQGGDELVRQYWEEAIGHDSQSHARELILGKGFEGMKEYWGHTLQEEGAEYTTAAGEDFFRLDMHDCPSKGFLLDNGLEQYSDYCDHCIGWIGPMMKEAGFVIHHEHNHHGQCWWEFNRSHSPLMPSAPGERSERDVRLTQNWNTTETPVDRFIAANSSRAKK